MEGFMFANADEAMKFYEACQAENADTAEKRIAILRRFVKDDVAKYVPHPEEIMKGRNVVVVKKDGTSNGTL
jgi:hypothetical protein